MTRSFRDPVLIGDADERDPHRTEATAHDAAPPPDDAPLAELFVDDPFEVVEAEEPLAELIVVDPLRSPMPPSGLPPTTEPTAIDERFRRLLAGPFLDRDRARSTGRLLLAAVLLLAELVVAIYALATRDGGGRAQASTPPVVPSSRISYAVPDPAATVAVDWARRSLSREAVILADPATAAALRRAGFTRAADYAFDGRARAVDYLIDVASSPASSVGAARERAGLRDRALPLAVFGRIHDTVVAREVFPTVADRDRAQSATDADLRRRAGQELLGNPRLEPDSAVRELLRTGTLDLRAETVLSDLAGVDRIGAVESILDPAEERAGRPVRSLAIVTTDLRTIRAVLAAIRDPYRPDSIVVVSPRKLRLTWMPAIAAAPTAGG